MVPCKLTPNFQGNATKTSPNQIWRLGRRQWHWWQCFEWFDECLLISSVPQGRRSVRWNPGTRPPWGGRPGTELVLELVVLFWVVKDRSLRVTEQNREFTMLCYVILCFVMLCCVMQCNTFVSSARSFIFLCQSYNQHYYHNNCKYHESNTLKKNQTNRLKKISICWVWPVRPVSS